MNDITPVNRSSASTLNRSNHLARPKASVSPPTRGSDKAEFSQAARLLSRIADLPDIRQEKVNQVRAEIANGTYLTEDKIEASLDGLITDLSE